MTRRCDMLVPAIAATACVLAPPLVLLGARGPVPAAATLLVLALAPGTALLGPRSVAELGLVVGLSVAVCVLAGEAMLVLGAWAPGAATAGVAVISLPALVIRVCQEVGNGRGGLSEPQHAAGSPSGRCRKAPKIE